MKDLFSWIILTASNKIIKKRKCSSPIQYNTIFKIRTVLALSTSNVFCFPHNLIPATEHPLGAQTLPYLVQSSCWQTRASGVQEGKVSYLGNSFWGSIGKEHRTGSQGTWILVFVLSLRKSFQLFRPQFRAQCGHWISDSHSWRYISHLGFFKRPGCQRRGPESVQYFFPLPNFLWSISNISKSRKDSIMNKLYTQFNKC